MFYLGIDGGGTKTELLLKDQNGKEIERLFVGPCNPNSIGMSASQNVLKIAINEILKNVDYSSVNLFAGISGGGLEKRKNEYRNFFSKMGFNKFDNGSDNENIVEQGLKGREGITIIAGTGICLYKSQNGVKGRCGGGWGFFLDQGGGGFNFGKDALKAYFSFKDGVGEQTCISEYVEKDGKQKEDVVFNVWKKGNDYIASFCPVVFKAAKKGDKVALKIIDQNINAVINLLDSATKTFDKKQIPVVLAGSFAISDDFYINFIERLPKGNRYKVEKLQGCPVDGAISLAMKL